MLIAHARAIAAMRFFFLSFIWSQMLFLCAYALKCMNAPEVASLIPDMSAAMPAKLSVELSVTLSVDLSASLSASWLARMGCSFQALFVFHLHLDLI